jgi:hypothetical protein
VFAGAELVDLLEDYPDSEVLEMEPDAYKGQYTHIIGDTVTPEVLCKVQAAVEGWDRHQIHTRTFYDISECTDSEIENMPVPDSAADEWALMYDDLSESVDVEVEEIREQAKWYGILSVYRSE